MALDLSDFVDAPPSPNAVKPSPLSDFVDAPPGIKPGSLDDFVDSEEEAKFRTAQPAFSASTSYLDALTKTPSQSMEDWLKDVPPEVEKEVTDTMNAHAGEQWVKDVGGPYMADQIRQHNALRAAGVNDIDQPILFLPKPSAGGAVAGLTRGAEQNIEGMATLKNVGIIGASMLLPKPLQKVVGAAFLMMMGKGVVEDTGTALDPTKTNAERWEAAGRAASGGALVGLGVKGEFGRPAEGGALPEERTGGLTQEQADAVSTKVQMQNLAPKTAPEVEQKPTGRLGVLDGMTLARRKLIEGFSDAAPEEQQVRQFIIDHIDDTLLKHDRQAVSESEARTAQREGTTPPEAPAGATETAPVPPAQGGRSSLFSQALAEQAPAPETIAPETAKAFNETTKTTSPEPTAEQPKVEVPTEPVRGELGAAPAAEPVRQSPLDQLRSLTKDAGSPNPGEKLTTDLQKVGRVNRDPAAAVARELGYYSSEEKQQLQEHLGTADAESETLAKAITGKGKLKEKSTVSDYVDEPGGAQGRGHPTQDVAKEAFGEDYTGGPGAMGPREAAAMAAGQGIVSSMKEDVNAKRAAEGQPLLVSEERKSNPTTWAEAEERIEQEPDAGKNMVEQINDGTKKVLTHVDRAVLTHELITAENQRDAWRERAADVNSTDAERTAAQVKADEYAKRLDDTQRAARTMGTEAGRGLQIIQMQIKNDFTPAGIERQLRSTNGGPLEGNPKLEKIQDEAKELAEKYQQSQKEVEKLQKAADEGAAFEEMAKIYEKLINEVSKEKSQPKAIVKAEQIKPRTPIAQKVIEYAKSARDSALERIRARRAEGHLNALPVNELADYGIVGGSYILEGVAKGAKWTAKMVETFGPEIKKFLKEIRVASEEHADRMTKEALSKQPQNTEQAKARFKADATAGDPLNSNSLADSARAHIRAGVTGVDEVMAAVHKDVKEAYPNATEEDVRKGLVKYGSEIKQPTKDAIEKRLQQIKSLVKVNEDIRNLQKTSPEEPWKSQNRPKPTDELRRLIAKRSELLKEADFPETETSLASKSKSRERALENRIKDIEHELSTGEKPLENKPVKHTAHEENLMMERDALQQKLNEVRAESKPKPTEADIAAENAQHGVDRAAAALDRQQRINSGELRPDKGEKSRPMSALEKELRDRTEDLRKAKREADKYRSPEDIESDKAQKAVDRAAAALDRQQRINSGEIKPTPKEKAAPLSELEKELKDRTQELKDTKKAAEAKSPEERYNERRMKQVERMQKDLQDRLDRKDYGPKPKPEPLKKTPELDQKEEDLAKLRSQMQEKVAEVAAANRSPFRKTMDFIVKLNRANVLGHASVIEHLLGAAGENLVTRPIGTAFAQLLRFNRTLNAIRKKAVYEGTMSFKSEGAGIKATLGSYKQLLSKLKTGKSNIDFLYEKGRNLPQSWVDAVGHVHGAIKEPIRQGIFARSVQLDLEAAREQGLKPEQDKVLLEAIKNEAYVNANADIMAGDNFISNAFHKVVTGYLRGERTNPGLAKFTADVMDILLPVTNIPVNIAIRKLRLLAGVGESAVRLSTAAAKGELKNGAETLSRRDAELITKTFKYGLFGVSAGIYAWKHKDDFGGVYVPGKNAPRNKTGLKQGEVRVDGHVIPAPFLHGPLGGFMNLIADSARVYDNEVRHNPNSKWANLGETGAFTMMAGIKDIPVFNTIGGLTSPFHTAGEKLGRIIRNMFVPGLAQDVAEKTGVGAPVLYHKKKSHR